MVENFLKKKHKKLTLKELSIPIVASPPNEPNEFTW